MESLSQTSLKRLNLVETKGAPQWNYIHCVQNLFPPLPSDLLLFGSPERLPCFFANEKRKEGYQLVSLTPCLISHSTSHSMSFCSPPIFIFIALTFSSWRSYFPLHSSCKFHDTFLDRFVVFSLAAVSFVK